MKTISAILMFSVGSVFADCPTPTPPPTVSATPESPYGVRFQVNPASPPTAGYVAERKEIWPTQTEWEIFNVGYPTGFIHDVYKREPLHVYLYKTRARTSCNGNTLSVYTPEVMVMMPEGPPPNYDAPEPPTNLVAVVTSNRVTLTWQAGAFWGVPGQTQVFQVQRSLDGRNTWLVVNFTVQTSLLDNNVHSGQRIDYRVRSFNGFGWTTEMPFDCPPNTTDCGTEYTDVVSVLVP